MSGACSRCGIHRPGLDHRAQARVANSRGSATADEPDVLPPRQAAPALVFGIPERCGEITTMANSSKPSTDNSTGEAEMMVGANAAARHSRQGRQCRNVVGRRVQAEADAAIVVDHQHAERLAARSAELVLVDPAERMALVEFRGTLQVTAQFRQETFRTLVFTLVPGSMPATSQRRPRHLPSSRRSLAACRTASSCVPMSTSIAATSRSGQFAKKSGSAPRCAAASGPNQSRRPIVRGSA